jgi:hypothetical protein
MEAAQEGVGDDDQGAHPQRRPVLEIEGVLEQDRPGDQAGRGVEGEEDQDDQRREDAQQAALVVEAVLQVIGKGQGILGQLGVAAQTGGDELPVQIGPDREPDGDPDLTHAQGVYRAGQAQEQPAAHVRGPGAQGGDAAAKATAAEDVVGQVAREAVGDHTEGQHSGQVEDEGDEHRAAHRRPRRLWSTKLTTDNSSTTGMGPHRASQVANDRVCSMTGLGRSARGAPAAQGHVPRARSEQ